MQTQNLIREFRSSCDNSTIRNMHFGAQKEDILEAGKYRFVFSQEGESHSWLM